MEDSKNIAEAKITKAEVLLMDMQKIFLEELKTIAKREGVDIVAILSIGITHKSLQCTKGKLGILSEGTSTAVVVQFLEDQASELRQQSRKILQERMFEIIKNGFDL
jgi:hypothetical protein